MISSYFVIFFGWLLGILLVIVVQAAIIHKSTKYEHTFTGALKIYLTKEIGPLITGFVIMMIAAFLVPEVIANVASGPNPTEEKHFKYVVLAVRWLRGTSVLIGITSQSLGILIVMRTSKWFSKKEES